MQLRLIPFFVLALVSVSSSYAQTLPGPADVNRIIPERNKLIIENVPTARPEVSAVMETVKAPEGAEKITLLLKEVRLEGVTAFNATEMQSFYKESLGKTVTLDKVWQIAAAITAHYRKEQFFLSRAYLPAQEIENGVVTIKVVEGYIAHVTISDELQKLRNVSQLIEKITASRPITAHQLEAFTLRLNDLPDARFFSVLRPLPDNHDGGVELVLKDEKKLFGGSVNFDNSGSRFLGPYQTSATLRANLLAQQETTLSVLNSIPTRELRYVALSHDVQLIPGWALELSGNVVEANPGSSLEENDINSESVGLGAGITYQPVRQYLENLRLGAYVDARNTNTDILGDIPLVRDRVRALRLGADYDLVDRWNGFNKINILFSQGIGVLGANDRGDDNLSRTEATPVFTTFQTDYTRHQALPYSLALVGQFSSQVTADRLPASEEFGIGGPSFGRAYDLSEIMGDEGVAGSLEVRYQAIPEWRGLQTVPYIYYDLGKVWNNDTDGESFSAASAGLGVRFAHELGINAQLGLAFPLTREPERPIYGDHHSPRLLMQLGYGF